MDILIHSFSGAVAAQAVLATTKWSLRTKLALTGMGFLAGAFPDLDVLSRWSGFNATFGKWLDLAPGREIYKGTLWYSHHALSHSLIFAACFALFVAWIINKRRARKAKEQLSFVRLTLVFFAAYMAHLIGDLPTPGGPWDGIALFWPSAHYSGGYGVTWWWNNYDIFLLVVSAFAINFIIVFFKSKRFKLNAARLPMVITGMCLLLCVYQLNQRPFDFNAQDVDFKTKEKQSLKYQRELLGDPLFKAMKSFDDANPIPF